MITIPWKTIGRYATTACIAGVSSVIAVVQQKNTIENVGERVGKEILKNLKRGG